MAGPTVQALAESQQRAELERQQIRSDLNGHMDGCVQAQKRVEKRFDDMEARFGKVDGAMCAMDDKLNSILSAQGEAKASAEAVALAKAEMSAPKWWHSWILWIARGTIGALAALLVALVTMVINDRFQINSLQNNNRPAASVTVSPAVAPAPAPPAPAAPTTPPGTAVQAPPADDTTP